MECPKAFVGQDVCDLIYFADLMKRGIPPVPGGALDQPKWFMDGCSFLWSEQDRLVPRLKSDG